MKIGFSTTNSPVSKVIKFFTRSKVSHAYIVFDVAGEQLIIHSTQKGVNCDYYPTFAKNHTIVAEYEITADPEKEKLALAESIKLLDQPYDFLSIVGFVWVLTLRAIGIKARAPFKNRSAYYCSELGLMILRKLDMDCPGMERELTSPEDLLECLEGKSEVKRVI